jgi:FkbM family methyltransferase
MEDEFTTGSASLRPARPKNILDEIVTCATLDDFVEAQALDRLDVKKIGVEGYESTVPKCGHKTLGRFHPVLLAEV